MEKTYLISIFFILASTGQLTASLTTFEDFKQYAQNYPEEPPVDNEDLFNPDYTTFYQSIKPTLLSRFTNWLGLSNGAFWDGHEFKQLLEEVVNNRQIRNLTSNQVVHIRCHPDTTIYVWSDIHGVLHSFLRSLEFLLNEKVIDNSLKIIKPNTYLVINGNAIDYAAYNLETLQILLLLLKQNPDTIFYLRGAHESEQYWRNITLKTELEVRAAHLSNESVPLESLINTFFNTLPLAIYFSINGSPSEVIRISPTNRDNPLIDEQNMGNLFTENTDTPITYYIINEEKKSTNPVDIKVLIKSIDWLKEERITTGLELLEQDRGTTVWSVESTPTKVNQVYFNLFTDSFAVVQLGKTIDTTTLTLYQNMIQTPDKFNKIRTYNLVTAIPEGTPAYTQERKSDIFIGSTMTLVLGSPTIGKSTRQGMLVCVNEINKSGGIDGHHIRAIVQNDDYMPHIARENILNFIKDGITTILLPVGSPTLEAYLDLIEEKKVFVVFPATGAPQFRKPEIVNLVNLQPSYTDEAKALINYLLSEYGISKIAFFYQNDAYGQGPTESSHQLLKSKEITNWIDVPYTRGAAHFQEQVSKIRSTQPEAIGFYSIPKATDKFINTYGIPGLSNIQLFGLSDMSDIAFKAFIKSYGIKILISSFVPNPYINQLEIVKEYRLAMDFNHHFYNIFSLQAYIATRILIQMLKEIGEPFTNDRLLSKIESLNNYEFKGLTLTFNPKNRDLSQPVWIETGDDKEWTAIKA